MKTIQYDESQESLIAEDETNLGLEQSDLFFSSITPLIDIINSRDEKINNSDLEQFMESELEPQKVIEYVDQLLQFNVDSNYSQNSNESKYTTQTFYIFRKVLTPKLVMLGLLNLLMEISQLSSILFLDLATDSYKIYDQNDRSTIQWPMIYSTLMMIAYVSGIFIESMKLNTENHFSVTSRTIGQYLIYQKAMKTKYLQETIQKNKTSGKEQQDGDEQHLANVNNLLTVDVNTLCEAYWAIFQFFVSIITIVFVFYYFFIKLGNSALTGLIFIILSMVFYSIFTFLLLLFRRHSLKHGDDRIGLQTDVLDGIKNIKYLSWEETFNNKILEIRNKEFKMLSCYKMTDSILITYWDTISYILLYILISTYLANGNKLEDANIFTIIALANTLTFPMGIFTICINQAFEIKVSYDRVQNFLNMDEINPDDVVRNQGCKDSNYAIQLPTTTFIWPVKKTNDNINKMNQTKVADTLKQDDTYRFQLEVEGFNIVKNSLTMFVGRIGAGKTSLFNAILNEMQQINNNDQKSDYTSQQIIINGTIGYVSQNHWLQNMSVRENILFGKPYEKQWYLTCIKACELVDDLLSFPTKDQFILGPDAKNISGGQKQRISICRALYQDCDIYLLDDIFSSLDMKVADCIFTQVVDNLLLARGKTVLMITQQFRFLEMSSHKCQIMLVENARVVDDPNSVCEFISQELIRQSSNESQQSQAIDEIPTFKKQFSLNTESVIEGNPQTSEEEERYEGEIATDSIKYYLDSITWTAAINYLFFSVLTLICRSFIDFWLRSEISLNDDIFDIFDKWLGNDFQFIFLSLIGVFIGICIIKNIFMTIGSLIGGWTIFKRLNASIMNSKMSFFDISAQGSIITRISADTNVVDDSLPWFCSVFINNFLECIGYPIGIAILFPWISIVIIVELYLIWQLQKIFRKSNRDLKRINSVNQGTLISHLTETTSGLRIIRSFQKEEQFIMVYIQKLRQAQCSNLNSNKLIFWLSIRLLILSNMIFLTVIITIMSFMFLSLELNYSSSSMTLTYAILIGQMFNFSMQKFAQTETRMVSVERIQQYNNNQVEDQNKNSEDIQINQTHPNNQNSGFQSPDVTEPELNQSSIIFKNVSLTYDDITQPQPKYALKNINLTIRKGEKIAFVGRTGSGKTSLLNILFRLYDFQQGQIFVQGKDIQSMQLTEVRTMMSVVPQFGFLYNSTLRDNMDPQKQLSDSEIEAAFNKTGFQINGLMGSSTQELSDNKVKLDFMIAKAGSNLSNGERQVINFMRTILQSKDIVCLDEASSNMDPKTDEQLHSTLFHYAENKTLLVITHRLENIKMYDRIVVLDQGEIKEIGSYDELITVENGLFAQLAKQS